MKKLSKRLLSTFLALLMVLTVVPIGTISASAITGDEMLQKAINWAVSIANDDSHGYSQEGRTGPDYDCSSLVGTALNKAGFNVPCNFRTTNMDTYLTAAGFVKYSRAELGGLSDSSQLQAGDILWRTGHTELYIGNNQICGAHSGTTNGYGYYSRGEQKGDQTGKEINVKKYYAKSYKGVSWEYVYRYAGATRSSGNDYSVGTYKCNYKYGTAMRSGASTSYGKVGFVPYNWDIYVWKIDGDWGYGQFAGKQGWVCLNYFTKTSVPVPATPTISSISATDTAKGKNITITWNAVSGAESYTVAVRSSSVYQDINVGSATSYSYTLSNAETYYFYVNSSNVSGSSSWSSPKSCTAHNDLTVQFVDWDNTPLTTVNVKYGENAAVPSSPSRQGYTFQGWSDSFYSVTSNKIIKATYKINTYTVNFKDMDGNILKTEKVEYGSDATPPTETNAPTGYSFLGWDSESYKNVYTDSSDKTININGIYSWSNDDLPVICQNVTATRQTDGYYVNFGLINYDKAITRGRAIVSLKTASGKLVEMTESAAFSLPIDTNSSNEKSMEVFIPCDYAATSVEIIIVNSYSSGVPISEKVTASIDQGLMWSDWSETESTDEDAEVESRTEYRYRDKETATGNTKTKDGWTYSGTFTTSVGSWSSWSWNSISEFTNESTKREVQTQSAVKSSNYKTVYNYYRYAKQYSGGYSNTYQTTNHPNYYEYTFDTELSLYATGKYKWWYSSSNYSVLYPRSPYTSSVKVSDNYATQYRYRDTTYTYNFYRWKDWSDWQTSEVTATDDREVETRTTYRYKSISAATEDDSGNTYTQSGTLDTSFAGKQITLFVYKVDGASDYTNEYVGQSVVGEDGSYSFTFKLREEPTVKTGDFTIAIGIEGTSNIITVGSIEAPKPTYTVNFYDWEGNIISTQTVTEGEDAVLPDNPEKEGYDFVGWDKSVSNITEDTDIFADFEKQEFTVIFVDWENQQIEVKSFGYGDILTPPDAEEVEGYTFSGWDKITDDVTTVTQNMIVTAQYEANEYTIKFYDWNNNVIDTQTVKYGETAVVPDDPEEDGVTFANWYNPEDYQYVERDAAIYPIYYFDETTDIPTVNYNSGEYSDTIELTLTSTDENAVIYYYFNGDETTEQIYTEPVAIEKTCSVTYFATSLGKNDSEECTGYYCINNSDNPSEWMLYSDLPSEVTENIDDYVLESDTGYRYKDTLSVSAADEVTALENSGWTFDSTTYTDYTDWQDEGITVDESLTGFEVETQEVADTSVTRYQYLHYKYTDSDGNVQYSPTEVDGYECEYETVILDSRLSIAGFTDDNVSYYTYNSQTWFKQTKVSGVKTQYRSRYKVSTYYKWTTSWSVDSPSSNEKREYESDDVYRYSNKKYHIVDIISGIYETPITYLVQDGQTIDTSLLALEHYTLDGLYTDENFTNEFDAATAITESVTLYVSYAPMQYTVVFQMQDGTEIDTQTVDYLESATAPETDVVTGYVFNGWDKDFDCITEDTVITGSYLKESEYARVSLDRSTLSMFSGTAVDLTATITPTDLTDEQIEWTTSDSSVATVNENGTVTAVAQGTAVITVTVLKTKQTATCEVIVSQDLTTSLMLKTNSSLNYDSLGYLRKISFNTSVQTLSEEYANENLRYFNQSGTELSSDDNVGTGTQVRLYNNGEIVDTDTIVITGDTSGDGKINNRDVAFVNRYLVGKVTAEEYQALAIDVNGDGYVNNRDAAMIARYLVGKDNF